TLSRLFQCYLWDMLDTRGCFLILLLVLCTLWLLMRFTRYLNHCLHSQLLHQTPLHHPPRKLLMHKRKRLIPSLRIQKIN
ncbi:UNVERIFIED_CONTAM: hypothetical protein HDU68_007642, partial [Siphonaria sp. JEL0065]